MAEGKEGGGGAVAAVGCLLIAVTPLLIIVPFFFMFAFFGAGQSEGPVCGDDSGPGGDAVTPPDIEKVPEGPIAGYGHEQLVNAAWIMSAGVSLELSARDQQIGIMTAMGESTLTIIDHGDEAGPDSRGLFQQRDNGAWGSYEDRMDPFISSQNFFKVLKEIPNRDSMEPTLVAHEVQANADPYHYAEHWDPAGEVFQALSQAGATAAPSASASDSGGEDPTPGAAPTGSTEYPMVGPVKPHTAAMANTLGPMFGFKTIGGYREGDTRDPNGHPMGLALDFMTNDFDGGQQAGQDLADYLEQNADTLDVKYIIWEQHIWNIDRRDEGWRLMEDRGSPTQNHMDHVHVSLKDADGPPGEYPDNPGGGGEECEDGGGEGGDSPVPVTKDGWTAPSDAAVTSPWGMRTHPVTGEQKMHNGTDFSGGCDYPIYSVQDGTVVQAGYHSSGLGNAVVVDHGEGIVTTYGHMFEDDVKVKTGDTVKAGQQIGQEGTAGMSTGCHLHFIMEHNGENINGYDYLKKAGVKLPPLP